MRTGDSAATVAAKGHGSWAVDVTMAGQIPLDKVEAVVAHHFVAVAAAVDVEVVASFDCRARLVRR